MVSVVLSIGSNCGDRRGNVEKALDWLRGKLMQMEDSGIYETPCAKGEGRPYMNAVVKGFYQGTGMELDEELKEKEREMGRTVECRGKGDVPIDIDIVVCDNEVWKEWDWRQKFFREGYSRL